MGWGKIGGGEGEYCTKRGWGGVGIYMGLYRGVLKEFVRESTGVVGLWSLVSC